jgi:WHG domain-containing protein
MSYTPARRVEVDQLPEPHVLEHREAHHPAESAQLLEPVLAVLGGFGLEGDVGIHAARSLRSAMHGFVDLERVGGFGLDLDLDESYRFLIRALAAGVRA